MLPPQVDDVEAVSAMTRDGACGARDGIRIGGIVEHLHLEVGARMIQRGNRVDRALHDDRFVEHRQLDGDDGNLVVTRRRDARGLLHPSGRCAHGVPAREQHPAVRGAGEQQHLRKRVDHAGGTQDERRHDGRDRPDGEHDPAP